jgi:hypothetical protein
MRRRRRVLRAPEVVAERDELPHLVGSASGQLIERPCGHGGSSDTGHGRRAFRVTARLEPFGRLVALAHELLGRQLEEPVDLGFDVARTAVGHSRTVAGSGVTGPR